MNNARWRRNAPGKIALLHVEQARPVGRVVFPSCHPSSVLTNQEKVIGFAKCKLIHYPVVGNGTAKTAHLPLTNGPKYKIMV